MKSSTAVLVPAYKRPEYTHKCLQSVLDAQSDYEHVTFYIVDDGGNKEILDLFPLKNTVKIYHEEPFGLRNTIIEFFDWLEDNPHTYITKIDNDCTVPFNWLKDLTEILEEADADIISPNVSETNAAHKYGYLPRREGAFIPSKIVGGLWFMKKEMISDIFFEKFNSFGINAAFNIIHQIVAEKDPKIGWTDKVTYQDIGYLSGSHPDHIKSKEHQAYSAEVGRHITWRPDGTNVQN